MRRMLIAALIAALALVAAACAEDEPDEAAVDEPDADAVDEPDADEDEADDADEDEAAEAVEPGDDWPDPLRLTLTPSAEAGELIDDAQPLAEMLEERLGVEVEPSVPTDYAGVIVALGSGEADVSGGLGPVQMTQAVDDAGGELLLQSERFGEFVYVSQWFTNDPDAFCADEPVEETYEEDGEEYTMRFCNGVDEAEDSSDGPIGEDRLAEVDGRAVSYVEEGSTAGFLYPALQLLDADIDPIDDVEEIFAGGHDNSVISVYQGDADVGVSFNDAREDVVEQFDDVGEELVVFAWSDPIPNDGFAVAPGLPDDFKEAVSEALRDIADTEEGAEVLNDLYNIDGLVEADPEDFEVIREARDELDDLIEE